MNGSVDLLNNNPSPIALMTMLPPKARICLPPALSKSWQRTAADAPHPAWSKIETIGNHHIVHSSDLDDLSEIADWATVALAEPEQPLSRAERQAYATLIKRVERWAVLEPLGKCHVLAVAWKPSQSYKQS